MEVITEDHKDIILNLSKNLPFEHRLTDWTIENVQRMAHLEVTVKRND